jgi:hypothetical protein
MIQRLIPVVHILQDLILADHTLFGSNFFEDTLDLERHIQTSRGEETTKTKAIALSEFE